MGVPWNHGSQVAVAYRELQAGPGFELPHMPAVELLPGRIVLQFGWTLRGAPALDLLIAEQDIHTAIP